MTPRRFDLILDDCLTRMDRGESLLEILSVYPDLESKLKPLLLAAMLGRALPQPVPGYTALRLGKNELLAEMASMRSEGAFLEPKPAATPRESLADRLVGSLKQLQPAYRLAMLSLVVILAGGFFTLSASASGLADNIMHSLFFSFEQIGDLLLVRPAPPKGIGESPIFSSDFDLPDSPDDYSGNYKGPNIVEDIAGLDEVDIALLQIRIHTFANDPDEVLDIIDDQEMEKEEEQEEKDLEDAEKDEEKDLKEEEKDEEKDLKEEEKDEEKALKEEEKDADKAEKEEEKDEKEAEKDAVKIIKDAEKDEKEEEKDKDK